MTTIATAARASTALVSLKGRGKAQREAAFAKIAPLSLAENMSRADSIENMRVALGANPSETETAIAQQQWMTGRIAARLSPTDFPKGSDVSAAGCIAFAFDLLTKYASAPKEGTKPRKLRHGQIGRRTPAQQKVVAAATEAWSQFAAELGLSNAKTQKEKNTQKATRAPHRNGTVDTDNMPKSSGKGTASKPTLGAAGPAKHSTRDEVCEYVGQMAATLLAYSNKHAKLLPTDFGMAISAFKTAINAAMNAEQERKAKASA